MKVSYDFMTFNINVGCRTLLPKYVNNTINFTFESFARNLTDFNS